MKNFGNSHIDSIALPLDPSKKIDPRGVVPVSQCKVITINENPVGMTSEEKAAREHMESQQRDLDKQRMNEDFMRKTKERLKEQRLKNTKISEEVEKPKETGLEFQEFKNDTFTFMDPEAEKDTLIPSEKKKPYKNLAKTIQNVKKPKKTEENPEKNKKRTRYNNKDGDK